MKLEFTISALVGRADVMDIIEEIFFSGTFGGETLSIAAAIALINKMQAESVIQTIWDTGKYLRNSVDELIASYELQNTFSLKGKDCWTILNIEKHSNASVEAIKTMLIMEMVANGVLMIGANNINYAHNEADVAQILNAYNNSFARIASCLKKNNIEAELDGRILQPVFKVR